MTAYLPADLHEQVAALRTLLGRLERVVAGASPIRRELAWAPLVEGWVPASQPLPAIVGVIDGSAVLTSRMWALDPNLRWALTEEGWLRLGQRGEA